MKSNNIHDNDSTEDSSSGELRDEVDFSALPAISRPSKSRTSNNRRSYSSSEASPIHSRSPSPKTRQASSTTSNSIYTVDTVYTSIAAGSRLSLLSRLRPSASTTNSLSPKKRLSVEVPDFLVPPEQPEKGFVDSIGIVCPGVCDRRQCASPLAHFVSTFRVCQPIEYTTALADHRLTYTDYCRLRLALEAFSANQDLETKMHSSQESLAKLSEGLQSEIGLMKKLATQKSRSTFLDTTEHLAKSKRQAIALNELLEKITTNFRRRGFPVQMSVSSFSMFAPHRISEAHVQILHAPLSPQAQSKLIGPDARSGRRMDFVDPVQVALAESRSISRSRPRLDRSASDMIAPTPASKYRHQKSQNRDRSRPWPLWPNAIPSGKRQFMNENADRYGVDPYFRAYLRAGINSRTKSSTYIKFLIEEEDDPFVNRRLQYTDASSEATLLRGVLARGTRAWQEQFLCAVNRAKYDHNRRLECRRTIEHGSRLRVARFGFRCALHPPHTAEMEELGLTKDAYQTIVTKIADLHTTLRFPTKCPVSYMLSSINRVRHIGIEDALLKVSEYIRELNASQRRLVWTIEKIPGVYGRGLGRSANEWEVSAWNGEDPLELLLELERWGIVEKRLYVEDDD